MKFLIKARSRTKLHIGQLKTNKTIMGENVNLFSLSSFFNLILYTVKALLSPGGAYLLFAVLEGGLNREGGLLERGGLL